MINLNSNQAKRQALFYIDRQMRVIETAFYESLLIARNKQMRMIADFIASGSKDIDHILHQTMSLISDVLKVYYKRIYMVFGDIILNQIKDEKSFLMYERKSFMDDFLVAMQAWVKKGMADKIVKIFKSTRKNIVQIIDRVMEEGGSNREIATAIRAMTDEKTKFEALRIARTETHTVAMKATSTAMESTGLKYTKEWVSAMDSRTRTTPFNHVAANGETVGKDKYYERTGESLFYPGDTNGSAGNVINCRCVEIYHTIRD